MSTDLAVQAANTAVYDGIKVPLTEEEKKEIQGLETQKSELENKSRQISEKLANTQEKKINRFIDTASVALGLNVEQFEELKPLFLRSLKNLSNLQGLDITRKAQDESANNLLATLFGGFVGIFLVEGNSLDNKSVSVIDSRRNLDHFENKLMEKLNLKEESGKTEVRQRIESFLEKEFPEAAKAYKALAEVKVFDPVNGIIKWFSNVLGGKDHLKSLTKDVKTDLGKLMPSMINSALSGDNSKVKELGQQAMKNLSRKYAPVTDKVTEAAKGLLKPENLNKIIKASIEAVGPAVKSKTV